MPCPDQSCVSEWLQLSTAVLQMGCMFPWTLLTNWFECVRKCVCVYALDVGWLRIYVLFEASATIQPLPIAPSQESRWSRITAEKCLSRAWVLPAGARRLSECARHFFGTTHGVVRHLIALSPRTLLLFECNLNFLWCKLRALCSLGLAPWQQRTESCQPKPAQMATALFERCLITMITACTSIRSMTCIIAFMMTFLEGSRTPRCRGRLRPSNNMQMCTPRIQNPSIWIIMDIRDAWQPSNINPFASTLILHALLLERESLQIRKVLVFARFGTKRNWCANGQREAYLCTFIRTPLQAFDQLITQLFALGMIPCHFSFLQRSAIHLPRHFGDVSGHAVCEAGRRSISCPNPMHWRRCSHRREAQLFDQWFDPNDDRMASNCLVRPPCARESSAVLANDCRPMRRFLVSQWVCLLRRPNDRWTHDNRSRSNWLRDARDCPSYARIHCGLGLPMPERSEPSSHLGTNQFRASQDWCIPRGIALKLHQVTAWDLPQPWVLWCVLSVLSQARDRLANLLVRHSPLCHWLAKNHCHFYDGKRSRENERALWLLQLPKQLWGGIGRWRWRRDSGQASWRTLVLQRADERMDSPEFQANTSVAGILAGQRLVLGGLHQHRNHGMGQWRRLRFCPQQVRPMAWPILLRSAQSRRMLPRSAFQGSMQFVWSWCSVWGQIPILPGQFDAGREIFWCRLLPILCCSLEWRLRVKHNPTQFLLWREDRIWIKVFHGRLPAGNLFQHPKTSWSLPANAVHPQSGNWSHAGSRSLVRSKGWVPRRRRKCGLVFASYCV